MGSGKPAMPSHVIARAIKSKVPLVPKGFILNVGIAA